MTTHITAFCAKHDKTLPEVLCRVLRGFRDGPDQRRLYTTTALARDVFTGSHTLLPDWTATKIRRVVQNFPRMSRQAHAETLVILRDLGLAQPAKQEVCDA